MSLTDEHTDYEQLIDALSWELEDLVAERQTLKVREAVLRDFLWSCVFKHFHI